MPTKRQNKNNKKDANSGNKIDNKINGITLDLVALLAFTLLAVSFFSANNMPFIMNAVSIMIFGAYFLGKAIINRISEILKNKDEDSKKKISLAINLILLSLLLFIPVRFFNDYIALPNTIALSFDFQRVPNGKGFNATSFSNATTFGTFGRLDNKTLDLFLTNNNNTGFSADDIKSNLTIKSPLQRMCDEQQDDRFWTTIQFSLDSAFLLFSFVFLSKLVVDIIGIIRSEKIIKNKKNTKKEKIYYIPFVIFSIFFLSLEGSCSLEQFIKIIEFSFIMSFLPFLS